MKKQKIGSESYGIIGLSRFGMALAQTLAEKERDIIVVDIDRQLVQAAALFTENALIVSDFSQESLRQVGIQNCDVVLVCLDAKIDASILTTLIVLQMGVKKVISHAINPDQGRVLEMLGAEVVYPEHDMAVRVANKLVAPQVLDYISLNNEIDIMEIRLTQKVSGRTVAELNVRHEYGLNIIASNHDGALTLDITPTLRLFSGDSITVIGKRSNIQRFEAYLNS